MPEPTPYRDPDYDADTDPRLDAAIARYPLAPLPDGFVERAMARIEAESAMPRAAMAAPASQSVAAPARPSATSPVHSPVAALARPPVSSPVSSLGTVPTIRFRLQFLDLVLPALFAGLACMGLALVWWSMDRVNPLWAAETELDLRLAWQTAQLYLPQAAFSVLLLACGLVTALGLGALLLMVLDQPFAAAASTRPAPTSPSIARTSPTQ